MTASLQLVIFRAASFSTSSGARPLVCPPAQSAKIGPYCHVRASPMLSFRKRGIHHNFSNLFFFFFFFRFPRGFGRSSHDASSSSKISCALSCAIFSTFTVILTALHFGQNLVNGMSLGDFRLFHHFSCLPVLGLYHLPRSVFSYRFAASQSPYIPCFVASWRNQNIELAHRMTRHLQRIKVPLVDVFVIRV